MVVTLLAVPKFVPAHAGFFRVTIRVPSDTDWCYETKANLDDALTLPFSAYLDAETVRFAECSGSAEAVAAARAFLDRG